MNQKILYQSIKNWLETQGFKILISGKDSPIALPIWDLTPMVYKIPDLIGVNNENKVVIVEVEQDKKKFTDVLGRCVIWKCIATFVYIAYPERQSQRFPVLEKLGIGQLSVNDKGEIKEIIQILPKRSSNMFKVLELHPLDYQKEAQLAKQLKEII